MLTMCFSLVTRMSDFNPFHRPTPGNPAATPDLWVDDPDTVEGNAISDVDDREQDREQIAVDGHRSRDEGGLYEV